MIKIIRFDCIWLIDTAGPTWTDLTGSHKTDTDFNFISATTDIFYFGMSRSRFKGFLSNLTTNGSYGTLTIQYWDGSTWVSPNIIDNYAFDSSKFIMWQVPDDWSDVEFTADFPYASAPPDAKKRYWMRISAASVTTMAVIDKIRSFPLALYTTPDTVSKMLNLKVPFSETTTPSFSTAEDTIAGLESDIDYKTQKSWKFNSITGDELELVDFNRFGVYPRYRDIIDVYSFAIWNGTAWNELTEGRNNDFLIDKRRGMVYITRLFLLPASYGMAGRYYNWGFGEFKASVRLDYSYGKDCERDPEFGLVRSIAKKKAAILLLQNHDYSILTVSGTDKVILSEKIKMWSEEVDKDTDALTAVRIW